MSKFKSQNSDQPRCWVNTINVLLSSTDEDLAMNILGDILTKEEQVQRDSKVAWWYILADVMQKCRLFRISLGYLLKSAIGRWLEQPDDTTSELDWIIHRELDNLVSEQATLLGAFLNEHPESKPEWFVMDESLNELRWNRATGEPLTPL